MTFPLGEGKLALAPSVDVPTQTAPWIGPLLELGARASRNAKKAMGRQLVIAVSVPTRRYVAVLIGCGWVLATEAPALAEPLDALREMRLGQPLRAVNSRYVITGTFKSLDETVQPARAEFAKSIWQVDRIRALAPLPELDQSVRAPRPEPGSIERMAQLDLAWDARLARPAADLAIVGTKTWLTGDFSARLARHDDDVPPSTIESLLMPKSTRAATWTTRIYSSVNLADEPVPHDVKAVILDGTSAIKYLADIEAQVIVCVVDRSVADETAAEIVVQNRNTRGEPISLAKDLGWRPPSGVEALGFTVPL